MLYKEARAQCVEHGGCIDENARMVPNKDGGVKMVDKCNLTGLRCWGHSCPSEHHSPKSAWELLDKMGLKEAFEKEMSG